MNIHSDTYDSRVPELQSRVENLEFTVSELLVKLAEGKSNLRSSVEDFSKNAEQKVQKLISQFENYQGCDTAEIEAEINALQWKFANFMTSTCTFSDSAYMIINNDLLTIVSYQKCNFFNVQLLQNSTDHEIAGLHNEIEDLEEELKQKTNDFESKLSTCLEDFQAEINLARNETGEELVLLHEQVLPS